MIAEKLTAVAEKLPQVYTAGQERGFEQGKHAERTDFWSRLQQLGNRTNYQYAFRGDGFDFDNFYPRYPLYPTNAEMMFYNWTVGNCEGSLKARLEEQGVVLSTVNAKNMGNIFAYSRFTELPAVNVTGVTANTAYYIGNLFAYCRILTSIDKIILNENTQYQSWFAGNTELAELRIQGVIGQSGFDFTQAKRLSHDSLMSIINALKDYSGDTTARTLTLGETHLAKLSDAEKAIATGRGWTLA